MMYVSPQAARRRMLHKMQTKISTFTYSRRCRRVDQMDSDHILDLSAMGTQSKRELYAQLLNPLSVPLSNRTNLLIPASGQRSDYIRLSATRVIMTTWRHRDRPDSKSQRGTRVCLHGAYVCVMPKNVIMECRFSASDLMRYSSMGNGRLEAFKVLRAIQGYSHSPLRFPLSDTPL
ncbi:hypothetical protein L208DRAFT_429283 [Tricholoma matsutake]|nr:hypothetical protein L208DRAFT_429283 [Tricholoma matsutake 945]